MTITATINYCKTLMSLSHEIVEEVELTSRMTQIHSINVDPETADHFGSQSQPNACNTVKYVM